MATYFIIIVYIAFISLGLPDSILGSAWPVMQSDLGAHLSAAGVISMFTSAATCLSSIISGRLIEKLGTGKLTLISVTMTAAALLGFSLFPSFWIICLLAIPLGLGAGAVDCGMNNFVSLNYKSRHMNWLHCFWGVGAMTGPMVMSFFIAKNSNWRGGYFTISMIQFCIAAILLLALPLWKRFEDKRESEEQEGAKGGTTALGIPGVKLSMACFLFYCAAEFTVGIWGVTYLVLCKGITNGDAAKWTAMFFGGITLGRFLCGFITAKLSDRLLIRVGQIMCAAGAAFLILPLPDIFTACALPIMGLGCAPIFPCMMQQTPYRFGKGFSRSVIGFQVASSYVGVTFMPLILGELAEKINMSIFPFFIIGYMLIILTCTEFINKLSSKAREKSLLKGTDL